MEYVSICCGAPVITAGKVTRYHICTKCNRACDVKHKKISDLDFGVLAAIGIIALLLLICCFL